MIQPHAVSPAMTQELLTLPQAADFMLRGKVAAAADIVETIARGSHWSIPAGS